MNAKKSGSDSMAAAWIVRDATRGDLDTLARFSTRMAEESEGRIYDKDDIRASFAIVMDDPSLGQMFIAEEGNKPVGCCMLNGREWSEWRNGLFYWMTGMYILPGYRRKGVRFDLYRHAVVWARAQPMVLGFRACVHKRNKLETVLGTSTVEIHNREEFHVKPMSQTPYVVIEVLF